MPRQSNGGHTTIAPVPDPYAHRRPPPAAALRVRRKRVAACAQVQTPSQPGPASRRYSTAARIWAAVHTGHSRRSGNPGTPALGNRGHRRFGRADGAKLDRISWLR